MSRTHFRTSVLNFSVGPSIHDSSAYLVLRDLRDEVLKKNEFSSKNRKLTAFVKASAFAQPAFVPQSRDYGASRGSGETGRRGRPHCPNVLRGELLLRKRPRGMPHTASGMPGNFNTDTERGQIQYNHNKRKQIHSHRQPDCGVHCQNANQPKESGLLDPNKNWVTELNQAD